MKTIALANMKGGVGKTSISVSLAAELAQFKEKETCMAVYKIIPRGQVYKE